MLSIAICSDVIKELENVCGLLEKFREQCPDHEISLQKFHSTYDLLDAVENQSPFDVYILDTIMPNISGIEAGALLRQRDAPAVFLYLISPAQAVSPIIASPTRTPLTGFITKPISQAALSASLSKMISALEAEKLKTLYMEVNGSALAIPYGRLIHVFYSKRRLHVTGSDGTHASLSMPKTAINRFFAPLLSDKRFLLIDEKALINMQHVSKACPQYFIMDNGDKLNLSPQYADVHQIYIDYVLGRGNIL